MFEADQIRVRAAAFILHGPQAQEVPCIIGRCGESEACMLQSCCGETGSARAGSHVRGRGSSVAKGGVAGRGRASYSPFAGNAARARQGMPAPTRGGGYWRGVQTGAFGW